MVGRECRCHTCGATFPLVDTDIIEVRKRDGSLRHIHWQLLPGPSWPPSTRRKSVCVLGPLPELPEHEDDTRKVGHLRTPTSEP